MMKKTGPSHAESNQCVCADGKGVRETARSRSKSSLTGPTSLEMLNCRTFDTFWLVTPTGNWADNWRAPAFGTQARSKGDGSDAHSQYLRLSYTQPDRST